MYLASFIILYYDQQMHNYLKLSHSYMFRHYCVILREFGINALPSYTSISNAAIGNTVYNQDVSHRLCASSHITGLFISPSGISELDCATTKTDTAERSISIGREFLQGFFCTKGLDVLPGSTARG